MRRSPARLTLVGSHGAHVVGDVVDQAGETTRAAIDPASAVEWEGRTWRGFLDAYDSSVRDLPVSFDQSEARILEDGSLRLRLRSWRPDINSHAVLGTVEQIADQVAGEPLPESMATAVAASRDGEGFVLRAEDRLLREATADGSQRIAPHSATVALRHARWSTDAAGRSVIAFEEEALDDHHIAAHGGYAAIAATYRNGLGQDELAHIARIIGRSGDALIAWKGEGTCLISSPVLTGGRLIDSRATGLPGIESKIRSEGLTAWSILAADAHRLNGRAAIGVSLRRETRRGDPIARIQTTRDALLLEVCERLAHVPEQAAMAAIAVVDMETFPG